MIATNLLLAAVLCAFAANSVLCRLALGAQLIDPVSFTTVRLVSGAVILALVLAARKERMRPRSAVNPVSALALFGYAIFFSLAYVVLDTATGALLVFAAVQLTMLSVGLVRGERPSRLVWAGAFLAASGLAYLLAPGVTAPPIGAAACMVLAGASWGIYSLRGAGKADPITATAWNFIAAAPLALVLSFLFIGDIRLSQAGIGWAVLSGAVTSGLGYVLWYAVLPRLSVTTAALVQISVPPLAAFGGIGLLGEAFSARLGLASIIILGGVVLVIAGRQHEG